MQIPLLRPIPEHRDHEHDREAQGPDEHADHEQGQDPRVRGEVGAASRVDGEAGIVERRDRIEHGVPRGIADGIAADEEAWEQEHREDRLGGDDGDDDRFEQGADLTEIERRGGLLGDEPLTHAQPA